MPHKLVFVVHHRPLAPDEHQGLIVVQHSHFVWSQKLFAIMSSDEFKKRVLHFEENTHIAAVYLIYSAFSPPIWYNFNQEVLV